MSNILRFHSKELEHFSPPVRVAQMSGISVVPGLPRQHIISRDVGGAK